MVDGVDQLSKMAGLSREVILTIWDQVKANQKQLDGCEGPHLFGSKMDGKTMLSRYRCSKCGGEVGPEFKRAYELGLAHGRKFPD